MKANRFLKKHHTKEDMVLQITAMADIFTVILVFLLKSFSTGVSNISPSSEVILPVAKAGDQVEESTQLEISPSAILVDGKPVTTLHEFKFESGDVESNGTPRSLNQALLKEAKREKRSPSSTAAKAQGITPAPPRMVVMADEKTPYSTLKTVMASAAISGFGDFKLIVVEDN